MVTISASLKRERGFRQSIQGKLILLLLVLLLPLLLFQAYTLYDRFQKGRAAELSANLELSRAVAKAFEGFLQDVLRQELTIGLAMTSSRSPTDEDINRILVESQSGHPAIAAFAWADPSGTIVAASDPNFVGINFSDRKHFEDIAAGRDWTVSDLVISKAAGEPRFVVMRAIRNERVELLGIVVANIVPDRLAAVLGIERSKGGAVSLVDSKGMLVFRYPSINPTWEQRNWMRDWPKYAKVFEGQEISESYFAPYEGKNRLVANVPVLSIGWAAGAGRTEEIAMEAITSVILTQATVFLFITLAALSLAFIVSRSISIPVRKLRNHALALGREETHDPAIVAGPVELRDLAGSFNEMAERLLSREIDLRRQGEWLRVTLTSIGDGVIATDASGLVTFINPVGSELTGWQFKEALGQPIRSVFKVIDEKTRKSAEDIVERVLREGSTVNLANNTALLSRAGREIPIEDSAAPIRDSAGSVIGMVVVFHDVTKKRRAQEALHSTNEELERFNRVAVDRELRMIELKKQINELSARVGLPRRYPIASEQPDAEEQP
jgi:PAS domain S-box-containing protein